MKSNANLPYTTISKFGKLNLNRDLIQGQNGDVEKVLNEIKDLTAGYPKRQSITSKIVIGERLLASSDQKMHTRYRASIKKPKRKIPVVRQYVKPEGELERIPGAAQYTPNFSIILPSAPQYSFSKPEDTEKRAISADTHTQSEMMRLWQQDIRLISFLHNDNSNDDTKDQDEKNEKMETNDKGLQLQRLQEETQSTLLNPFDGIAIPHDNTRNTYLPKNDFPGPGSYSVTSKSYDKNRVTLFDNQSSRPPIIPVIPDRSHMGLGQSIDATKPRVISAIPFSKQIGREKEPVKQNAIWDEIEAEQKALMESIQPSLAQSPEEIPKKKQPFALQTSYFNQSPFQHLIHTESPNAIYDVESSLKNLEMSRKILPGTNFGRRLDDNDRAIYSKSEAPDTYYDDVTNEWKQSFAPVTVPIFDNMVSRKSAYDYMPHGCGGGYQDSRIVWVKPKPRKRQPLLDKRKFLIEAPPDYHEKRVNSALLSKFVWE